MRPVCGLVLYITIALACVSLSRLPAFAQARKVDISRLEQTIGSWLLSCAADPMTDKQACRLRARPWLLVPGEERPGMALEVQLRAGHLVPVVTVRNLSLSTAWSGLLALTATAQIRFDTAPMAELPCTLDAASVVCAPMTADVPRLADELADAKTVLVRLHPSTTCRSRCRMVHWHSTSTIHRKRWPGIVPPVPSSRRSHRR